MTSMFDRDNGILRQVPGDSLAAGIEQLPPPGDGQPQTMTVEVDGGHVGRVRVTYQLMCHRNRRKTHYFWTPSHAEPITP